MTPIWLIGCGNMGGAMLRRWLDDGMPPERVTVITRSGTGIPDGVRHSASLPADDPGIVVLAVKPQQLDTIAPAFADRRVPLLVSILAGVDCATISSRIPAEAVVRAMPNLPVAIGKGVTALFTPTPDPAVHAAATALAAPLGSVEWVENEAQFDAVTALAGCGPGFVFRYADALAQAGIALGLAPEQARRLALATLDGSASMAAAADESPATLADRVASPGGSTREGLNVLDRDNALVGLMTATLAASARRNAEMAAEARR
ncbi:MAG TPA: pyrroline-5-carboxylate reductase [Sphingomonas sp.]|nr:pyrroline-5-carboxylate reductase [Sphingomonas sp.]